MGFRDIDRETESRVAILRAIIEKTLEIMAVYRGHNSVKDMTSNDVKTSTVLDDITSIVSFNFQSKHMHSESFDTPIFYNDASVSSRHIGSVLKDEMELYYKVIVEKKKLFVEELSRRVFLRSYDGPSVVLIEQSIPDEIMYIVDTDIERQDMQNQRSALRYNEAEVLEFFVNKAFTNLLDAEDRVKNVQSLSSRQIFSSYMENPDNQLTMENIQAAIVEVLSKKFTPSGVDPKVLFTALFMIHLVIESDNLNNENIIIKRSEIVDAVIKLRSVLLDSDKNGNIIAKYSVNESERKIYTYIVPSTYSVAVTRIPDLKDLIIHCVLNNVPPYKTTEAFLLENSEAFMKKHSEFIATTKVKTIREDAKTAISIYTSYLQTMIMEIVDSNDAISISGFYPKLNDLFLASKPEDILNVKVMVDRIVTDVIFKDSNVKTINDKFEYYKANEMYSKYDSVQLSLLAVSDIVSTLIISKYVGKS